MKQKRKLVAGLICGNEQERIERCVKSLQQICDDIVIVRAIGGLQPDATSCIARSLGCNLLEYKNQPLLADWPHIDDFSRARNLAFESAYALAGKDGWVMWADCDDIILPEMVEPHLKALDDCPEEYDWILTDYVIPEQNKRAPRERFFRYKTGFWYRPIHENVQPTKDVKVYMRRDLEIHHATGLDKTKSNERNMRILEHLDRMASHTKFYLHYENFIHGNKEKSARYGSEALAMQDLDGVHRYETLMNCATLTYPETAIRLLGQAQKLEPNRREAFALEANILMDDEKHKEAMEVIERMELIPIPKFTQWTHQSEWYGWKAYLLKAWGLRLLDRSQEADKIEDEMRKKSNLPIISLIHATRGRPIEAVKNMNLWLSRAKNPERIEYIFICDEDDEISKKVLKRFNLKIQKKNGYSVGAWNLGARESSGELIIQMSDDWECPPMWDELIEQRIDYTQAQVLRVSDGHRTDDLIGIAILTREYYKRYGLFNGIFKNVYSDTDFTFRAEKNNAIINARDITIIHHHPFWEGGELDETYARGNDLQEYARAKKVFERLHE